jgi:hypothetical protein
LSNFSPEEMEAAAKVMTWCTFCEGETIIQEGETITSASYFCRCRMRAVHDFSHSVRAWYPAGPAATRSLLIGPDGCTPLATDIIVSGTVEISRIQRTADDADTFAADVVLTNLGAGEVRLPHPIPHPTSQGAAHVPMARTWNEISMPCWLVQSFWDASLWAENSVLKRTATATAQCETHTIVFRKLDIMRVVKGNISMLFSPAFCIDVLHMNAEVSGALPWVLFVVSGHWGYLLGARGAPHPTGPPPPSLPNPAPPLTPQDRSVYHLECLGVLLSKMETFRRLPRPQLLEVCKHLTVRTFPGHG